jgi:hypothetical protein
MPRQERAILRKRRLLSMTTTLLASLCATGRLRNGPAAGDAKSTDRAPVKTKGRVQAKRVWRAFAESPQREEADAQFREKTLLSIAQFETLLHESALVVQEQIRGVATTFTFADKLLLVFYWLVDYPLYTALAAEFGTTITVVADLLREALPALATHFARFLSNEPGAVRKTERLVSVMGGVKDSRNRQDVTQLLLDERGRIVSFLTETTPLDRSVVGTKKGARSDATSFLARCCALTAERRAQQSREKRVACLYILSGCYNWLAGRK